MSAWFSRLKREYETGHLPAKQYLVLCELGRFDRCRLGIFPSRVRAAWRSLQGPNRYVLKVPAAAVQWPRRTGGQSGRRDTYDKKKEAPERSDGALGAMLEAARGLPDLLKARRDAMEARWRARYGGR
jgi:hypothetical protein